MSLALQDKQSASLPPVNPQCYARYCHTLRMAYTFRGWDDAEINATFRDFEELQGLPTEMVVDALLPSIRARLKSLNLDATLLAEPICQPMSLHGVDSIWPIINEQGRQWYENAPVGSFDFIRESELGLHENARVIYDIGGHHGIWALHYSHIVGREGRVYSYEPSIINIEISSLLFFVNSVSNVINMATAVGSGKRRADAKPRKFVDFVRRSPIEMQNIRNCCWDYADFMKMDIEGFEYEVLTQNPWIFDVAQNFHIELHIPHLVRRKLDYRNVLKIIPFEKFEVFNHERSNPVTADSKLSDFCSLMMRRK